MKIDDYDEQTLEQIRDVCQQLFHGSYILEYVFTPNDTLKKANNDYLFVMSHYDAIEELLDRCGWELCNDSRCGVLYLSSQYAQAKISLTKMESYFLLAMRLLYDDKKTQASASGEVFATTREIIEQLTSLGAVEQVNKQERSKALRTLAARNIIAKMSGGWEELDTRLAILPSVVCALSSEKTKAVAQMLSAQPEQSGAKEVEEA